MKNVTIWTSMLHSFRVLTVIRFRQWKIYRKILKVSLFFFCFFFHNNTWVESKFTSCYPPPQKKTLIKVKIKNKRQRSQNFSWIGKVKITMAVALSDRQKTIFNYCKKYKKKDHNIMTIILNSYLLCSFTTPLSSFI